MIVEYEFILKEDGRTSVPTFIVDGGYFSEGNKLVGIAANDGTYIPSTLVVLNKAALITKLTNMEWQTFNNSNGEYSDATAEEIEAYVDTFISRHDT